MKSDIKCSRCGVMQAEYYMHRSPDVHCTNMYKCLVRRMERVEECVKNQGSMLKEHDGKLWDKVPLDLRGKEVKVGGTD